jgi:hypothetical protein
MVPLIAWMAFTDSWVADWMPVICWPISPGRLRGLFGQRLHFGSHHREAGARRLDGGVQRQKIGLSRDGVDQFDHIADPACRLRQFAYAIVGQARLIHSLAGHRADSCT